MAEIYSHSNDESTIEKEVAQIERRLREEGDTPFATVDEKLEILHELTQFELGRFLIKNRGLNGSWSHYISYEYSLLEDHQKPINKVERMLVESNGDLELKVRLVMVRELLQANLFEGIKMLSVPCGVMADLLTLDFSKTRKFELFGIDLDPQSLALAENFSRKMGLQKYASFACRDAWNLGLLEKFDVVVSMGLNMYISSRAQSVELYKSLRSALKKGGKLMLSYMTPHPFRDPNTERDLSSLDPAAVRLHRMVMAEIIKTKIVNFPSTLEIQSQLMDAGFGEVQIHYSICKSPNVAVAIK